MTTLVTSTQNFRVVVNEVKTYSQFLYVPLDLL